MGQIEASASLPSAELTGCWSYLASPAPAAACGILMLLLYVLRGIHRDVQGKVDRAKLAGAFTLGAATYTFTLLAVAELFFRNPSIAQLIDKGFGDQRLGWLIALTAIDGILRLWENLVPKKETVK